MNPTHPLPHQIDSLFPRLGRTGFFRFKLPACSINPARNIEKWGANWQFALKAAPV